MWRPCGYVWDAPPTLTSDRVIVRTPRMDDVPFYMAWRTLPEVMRFDDRINYSAYEIEQYIRNTMAGAYECWNFSLESKLSGVVFGEFGFQNYNEIDKAMGVWIKMHPSYQGRGYATEVLDLMIYWAKHYSCYDGIFADIADENWPSRRLVARCGFKSLGPTSYVIKETGVVYRAQTYGREL